jgi:MarR family transcriptional regulator for hemolysin
MMNPDQTLGFLLHDVARLLRKRFGQSARKSGLSLTRSQWQVLAHLAKNEGIQQSALADLLEIEPSTLVRLLDKLEELGLVEHRPNASDRRIWLLFPQIDRGFYPEGDEEHRGLHPRGGPRRCAG